MRISLITPEPPSRWTGNRVTGERWAGILRSLGHEVRIEHGGGTPPYDVLVALHAGKSASSVRRSATDYPHIPIVVALTGTDLYGDLHQDPAVLTSLECATRIVTLQPDALAELPAQMRPRVHVIYQSVPPQAAPPKKKRDVFEVCVIGNLREVKDPFLTATAVRELPESSRIHVVHIGGALDQAMEKRATSESERNARYEWLGSKPRHEVLRLLARTRLMVLTSKMEGGANVISESSVCGVPVISTRISGSVGLLGADYPGFVPVGDAAALTNMLLRTESDEVFLTDLTARTKALAPLFSPDREHNAWKRLLDEL